MSNYYDSVSKVNVFTQYESGSASLAPYQPTPTGVALPKELEKIIDLTNKAAYLHGYSVHALETEKTVLESENWAEKVILQQSMHEQTIESKINAAIARQKALALRFKSFSLTIDDKLLKNLTYYDAKFSQPTILTDIEKTITYIKSFDFKNIIPLPVSEESSTVSKAPSETPLDTTDTKLIPAKEESNLMIVSQLKVIKDHPTTSLKEEVNKLKEENNLAKKDYDSNEESHEQKLQSIETAINEVFNKIKAHIQSTYPVDKWTLLNKGTDWHLQGMTYISILKGPTPIQLATPILDLVKINFQESFNSYITK